VQLSEALKVIKEGPFAGRPPLRVLVACGFHPLHLQTFLHAHLQGRVLRRVVPSVGLYGDLLGTLRQLPTRDLDLCAVAIEWPDLDPRLGFRQLGWDGRQLGDVVKTVESALGALREILARAPEYTPLALSLPTLPLPPLLPAPSQRASETELCLRRSVDEFALWSAGRPGIRVVHPEYLARVSPPAERFDFKSELLAGLPYTLAHADALASVMADLLVPPAAKKGLITDLDDTLWKGLAGEVGAQGLCWDLAGHAQVHGLYQQLLRGLAEQGVLIGIASKNDAGVVEEVFQREDILLPRQSVFPVEVHWGPKSGSVTSILKAWNIGAESVVFVDDSAMELAEVKASHPDVECVLFPASDYAGAQALLYRLRDLFAKESVSEEDRLRLESLRAGDAFRRDAAAAGDSFESFMRDAQGELTLDCASAGANPRSLDLVNKTNQFNLNGTRFTTEEWHTALRCPGAFAMTAAYRDKYGPLGVIAVVKGRTRNGEVTVDTWVMSCRAFGRRIEHQCLRSLFDQFGAEEIRLNFMPTLRNQYLKDFLAGFQRAELSGPLRVSRAAFEEKCPPLYHRVEISHD